MRSCRSSWVFRVTDGTSLEPDDDSASDDVLAVFGEEDDAVRLTPLATRRTAFAPWHHPVKQVVRGRQWGALTEKLVRKARSGDERKVLRYFTLPGADLLDVRVLAEACSAHGTQIEYFGFDIGARRTEGAVPGEPIITGPWTAAESALRQAGRITGRAVILPDRLEDIAQLNSHAAGQLSQQRPFDVVNLDACDNLAFKPEGRSHSTFDALDILLRHQMEAKQPWLLFITTRVDPGLLSDAGLKFQAAISKNLELSSDRFRPALADALESGIDTLASELAAAWTTLDQRFLKLFAIGLGKHLLQFYHNQPNLPSKVELASLYAYRVRAGEPDMLALAFRITPGGLRVMPAGIGGATVVTSLEVDSALYVVEQAVKLQDLDEAIEAEPKLKEEAVAGTEGLLEDANYDLEAWRTWVRNHPIRPMDLAARLDGPAAQS